MRNTIIYIFRKDFRLRDNPALFSAAKDGDVVPLYIYDENIELGGASSWWLHHTLEDIDMQLKDLKSYLIMKKGSWVQEIQKAARKLKAKYVYWNEGYDPKSREDDILLMTALHQNGVKGKTFVGNMLLHPDTLKTKGETPFKVYSAFWKKLNLTPVLGPFPNVDKISSPNMELDSLAIDELQLLEKWQQKFETRWVVGEEVGIEAFKEFSESKLLDYQAKRDFPYKAAISKLSPYIAFGQMSPRFIFSMVRELQEGGEYPAHDHEMEAFLKEIGWREFSYYLIYHYPSIIKEPLNKKFLAFNWEMDEELFERWKKGQTGYPFVDAGMRELWNTGYIHNRARMVVASFLTKHLLIPWQKGAEWFQHTLLDADIANNSCSWQWVAGSGADAQPFFRIFNPITQGEKFDPNGDYIRKWVPELKNLPKTYIHFPSKAPSEILGDMKLGEDYPYPVIDHAYARERAMERYREIK